MLQLMRLWAAGGKVAHRLGERRAELGRYWWVQSVQPAFLPGLLGTGAGKSVSE